MRFPRCSCSKQWGDGQLNWQTKHMIGFGMGGNHQLVLSFGFIGLLRVSKSGVYTRKQGLPPQFIGGFRTCFSGFDVFWDVFLASLILRFCIYNYIYVHVYIYIYVNIYTIHDILNSCGWRTGNPARFNRWSSLTGAIFQHERRMQQLVVSCILDFPTHFCGINPINTLFVRSWCTMRTFISLISTFVGRIRSARAATFAGVATRF